MFLALLGLARAEPLSVESAVALALKNAPDAAVIEARRMQAQAALGAARAGVLPQVSAGGTWQHWNTAIEIPNFLDPTADPIVFQAQDALNGSITASQVVFAPGSFARLAGAAGSHRAAEASAQGAQAELVVRVVSTWVGARSAHEVVAVASAVEADAIRHLAVAESQLAAGATTALSVDRARVQVAETHRRALDAAKVEADLIGQLAILVGAPVDALAGLPAAPGALEVPADSLERRADVRAATAAWEGARAAGTWSVVADWAPTVVANGQLRTTNSPGFTGEATTWFVGGSVNLPVLDGGLRFADARKARAQADEAAATLTRVRALAAEEIRSAARGLDVAHEQLDVARQAESAAQRAAELAERAFEAGTATSLDVEDARSSALDASVTRIRAEGALVLADIQLRRATATL